MENLGTAMVAHSTWLPLLENTPVDSQVKVSPPVPIQN
jgi:hypothetical protein